MTLANCNKCGRMMEFTGKLLCKRCDEEEADSYKAVREYVYNHRGANVMEVSEATGVDSSVILRYLKEEKLSLVDDRTILPRCRTCGTFIQLGDICNQCLAKESSQEKRLVVNKKVTSSFGRRRR